MYFVIGLAFSTFLLFILSVQISFYNELASDKFRFRCFEIRDRLAMMVVKGIISEDSWEYKHIIDSLNFHIKAVETMTIWKMASALAAYHMSPESERRTKKCEIENEKIRELMVDFLCVTRDLIYRNSKAQIKVVEFFNGVFEFFSDENDKNVAQKISKVQTAVAKPKQAINNIEHEMSVLSNHAAA